VILNALLERDPLHLGTDANARYAAATDAIVNYRNVTKGGVLNGFDELSSATRPEVADGAEGRIFALEFRREERRDRRAASWKNSCRTRPMGRSLFAGGMLIYLGFRFEWIYGVAAVLTVFHDTLITVGAFSLTNKEISLTVIAAILTLIGYSK